MITIAGLVAAGAFIGSFLGGCIAAIREQIVSERGSGKVSLWIILGALILAAIVIAEVLVRCGV